MAAVSPARKAAFEMLLAVERGPAHADDLLRSRAISAFSPADRNLTTALVLGALRWQIRLDERIRALLYKPNAKLDAEILIALRLGAFQLLHLDRVPAHAAIDESVELAKRAGHRFASGMVNAVLRKLSKAPHQAEQAQATVVELALAFAHPGWMVERWAALYGMETARAICAHGQSQTPLSIRAHDTKVEDELKQDGVVLEPGSLLTCARTVLQGDVSSAAAFLQGRVRIQDEGSQLVGELAATASAECPEAEVNRILDACAAPGGKTLILAERNPQAQVVACEQSPQRFDALKERLAVHTGRIECRLADASALKEDSTFDLVLVDAPCSGTGTLGRNPEIRHRLRLEDLTRHAERQQMILRAALRAVRPGGCVIYSTCSLEPEENEQVIAAVLPEMPNARQISLAGRIEALRRAGILIRDVAARLRESLTEAGALRLLPGAFPTDGFSIAMVQRMQENADQDFSSGSLSSA